MSYLARTIPPLSSYADSMLEHARQYAAQTIQRFNLTGNSRVVEIACNDGYLLRWFQEAGVHVLGVEPATNTAAAARELGIPVQVAFFGERVAHEMLAQGLGADLMPANNVVAHVPDINDFVGGFSILLKESGVATFEFHHVLSLLKFNQFDAIYHEHYYYHSLHTFAKILAAKGLEVFDVEQLTTHGGSLRVYAQRKDCRPYAISENLARVMQQEKDANLHTIEPYLQLNARVQKKKRQFLSELINAKAQGKRIVAYGAPAKGNTLLNYAGVRTDFIDYAVDRSPHKQSTTCQARRSPYYRPMRSAKPSLTIY